MITFQQNTVLKNKTKVECFIKILGFFSMDFKILLLRCQKRSQVKFGMFQQLKKTDCQNFYQDFQILINLSQNWNF